MASLSTSIPRFLLPGGIPRTSFLLRRHPRGLLSTSSALRQVSTKPPPKAPIPPKKPGPAVLAKPDKWRPPSHGKATPRSQTSQRSYGPKLTEEDILRMKTKKYPNMMSPEGSLSYRFIHNRSIHIFITFAILISLAGRAWWLDFKFKTLYYDLLPEKSDIFYHPINTVSQFAHVYRMHVAAETEKVQQMRLKKMEETEKRKQYRLERIREAEERGEEYIEDPRYYVGEDGVRRRKVKRWFGIWE